MMTIGLLPGPGGLHQRSPDMVEFLVLDVPGRVLEVWRMDVLVLTDVFAGRLIGGHIFCCGSDGDGGSGGDGGGVEGGGSGGCVWYGYGVCCVL